MKLYTRWQNSAGERVRIALNLKGLAYEYVPVGSLAPGEYARINPQGLLPSLVVGENVITQSAAILDYLEVVFPERPLLAKDPVLRAQALAFGGVVAAEMHAITVTRVRKFLGEALGHDEAAVKAWVHHWLGLGFSALEQLLAARATQWDYCFGDAPGWADVFLAPQVANGLRQGMHLQDYPLVWAIAGRCEQLEAFAGAKPEAQPDCPR